MSVSGRVVDTILRGGGGEREREKQRGIEKKSERKGEKE